MSGKCKVELGYAATHISTVGKSRPERLQLYMDTFTDQFKASWDINGDEEPDRRGRRPMKFLDFANHQLDLIETDVSLFF